MKIDFLTETKFEDILTNPILDICARLWDEDRYKAFKVCYRGMRAVDDLIDDKKAEKKELNFFEKKSIKKKFEGFLNEIEVGHSKDEFVNKLIQTIEKFDMPLTPWSKFCKAMIYDTEKTGFDSFADFLRYTEGAAIAPASIFMQLIGCRENDNKYFRPSYDIHLSARPLAIYSYVIHIVRDFEKDLRSNLVYFPKNMLSDFNLTEKCLNEIVFQEKKNENFVRLVNKYVEIAEYYEKESLKMFEVILPQLDERYQLSLFLLYKLYSQILDKVRSNDGLFKTKDLLPTPAEVSNEINTVVGSFNKWE